MTHPAVGELLLSLGRHPGFQALLRLVASSQAGGGLSGLTPTAKALYSVLLWQAFQRPLLMVVATNEQAEALGEAVRTFFNLLVGRPAKPQPQLLPAPDVLPGQRLSPHAAISEQRAVGLWRLACEQVPITLSPVASVLFRTEPPEFYRQLALTLRAGDEIPMEDLIQHLESIGYQKRDPVEMLGEYSVRGGILDVFPPESARPVRIEFFGDQVESMRRFEVDSQRSVL
ncbi:MAG: transcription-repair coupling factor, partial [Acidobacteriota bacterium]